MAKMRVYEYAKRRDMNSKELVTILTILGYPGKTTFSGLDDVEISSLNRYFAQRIKNKQEDVEVKPKKKAKKKPKPATVVITGDDEKLKQDTPKGEEKGEKQKKDKPERQKPVIRIIRREEIDKKKEKEDKKVEDTPAEVEKTSLSQEPEKLPEVQEKTESVATPQPSEEPIAKPVTTAEMTTTKSEESKKKIAPTTNAPTTKSENIAGEGTEKKEPEDKKEKKIFIKPPQPIKPIKPIGKAQGMDSKKPAAKDFSMEELEKQLLGKTYKPSEEKKEERALPVAPAAGFSGKTGRYSASGTRLDGREFREGGRKKKKTSRKEKKAAQKAKQRQLELKMEEERKLREEEEMRTGKVVKFEEAVTVKELCDMLKVDRVDIVKKIMDLGIMNISQKLDIDVATMIAEEYGFTVKTKEVSEEEEEILFEIEEDNPEFVVERPAIVTVMGHVDHGKTSLLDAIRRTNVVAGESGGITQHIGAYQVTLDSGKKITFLDTPGHEAFTAMRAHGAAVTVIAVLVVAADDGVQPQTIEAIDHAIAAEVPIIVAINKIDKPEANVDNVKQELAQHGLTPEDWGGDTICVEVSAAKKINIDGLLEMIMLVSEMKELTADPKRRAVGVIIEAKLDKGRGPVATVLIQTGTLRIADPFVVGSVYGKVRSLVNDKGQRIKEAGPSVPVEIVGISDIPKVGEKLYVVKSEKIARVVSEKHEAQLRSKQMASKKISLSHLFDVIAEGEIKDLFVVVKGDVIGSVMALRDSIEKLSNDKVKVSVVHSGVGQITENDVMLASASNAIIIGFHVRPSSAAEKLAQNENVEIRCYKIIYDCLNDIEMAMKGMLEPTYEEIVMGRVEVRETFKIPKIGVIAGCFVVEGKVQRNKIVRLIRDGVEVYEGKISSLKRFKDDVSEVLKGFECGIGIDNYNDIKVGDLIEVVDMKLVDEVGATSN